MNLQISGLKVDAKGEGTRGGKIIGHTGNGIPIYAHGKHQAADFNTKDHAQAAAMHEMQRKFHMGKGSKQTAKHHEKVRDQHAGYTAGTKHEVNYGG